MTPFAQLIPEAEDAVSLATATPTSEISTVATVFSLMTRLLAALAEHRVFKEAGIGLAEWSALRALSEHPDWRSGRISSYLGISPQRTAQLIASLRRTGLVAVNQSAGDARKKDVALTAAGKAKLEVLDHQVLALVMTAFNERPAGIRNAQRSVRQLLSAVRGPKAATVHERRHEVAGLPPLRRPAHGDR